MSQGFIKNTELLEEKSKMKDLLDFKNICAKFTKKVNSIPGKSIVALVGQFGTGKSTMLYQIMAACPENELWVEFDAWKYPDRKDLWEGFVIDLVKSISPQDVDCIKKKIKGTQNEDKKTLISVISKIPGCAVLEGFNHFLETSPAKRVDEIQRILREHLNKLQKKLFIIVEDIDRSGDAGIFFLETLKQFLRTSGLDKHIVVIVPMANENYQKNIDSYLKSIDYFDFFELGIFKLDQFVDEVFDEKLFSSQYSQVNDNRLIWTGANRRLQTISFFEGLFHLMPGMSMRLLKLIVRKANLVFKNQVVDDYDPDFRLTLCLEASKYFKINDTDLSYFSDFKTKNAIIIGNIFSSYLVSALINKDSIFETNLTDSRGKKQLTTSDCNFKFIDRVNNDKIRYPSYPWIYNGNNAKKNYGIASFYLNY